MAAPITGFRPSGALSRLIVFLLVGAQQVKRIAEHIGGIGVQRSDCAVEFRA
ncbi:hypothetical protein [Burkholderia vietnamiensis]|uniref:hypothetical protein n=1 Tax=Burkholderia vietnamiensis TaxID=60552 RepID=UPI0012DB05C8|nr:hypothetical protein [Burkholderia vietnamiensis]